MLRRSTPLAPPPTEPADPFAPTGREARRTRVGVTLAFGLAGVLVGIFTARIPALVDKLALTTVQLGTVLFVWGLGALCTMQAMRYIVAHVGSADVLRVATPLGPASVALVACAPSYPLLLIEVGLFGAAFGAVEVAATAQGSAVERAYGRSLMNAMHAGWPVGAGIGGVAAALCAHLGVSYTWCLAGAAAVTFPLALAAGRKGLPTPAAASGRLGRRARFRPPVYLAGLVVFGALALEGAVTDWSGVLLHDGLGSSQALAALAYPMFQAGMLSGRARADRLVERLGARTVLCGAGLAASAGLAAVAAVGNPWLALVGVFAVGVAISPLVPVAFSVAGVADPGRCDAAIAQAGTIGFVGLLVGPVAIGGLAHLTTLPAALAGVAVLLAALIVAAGQVLPARARPAS
jgi:hypothetical protein